MAVEGVEFVIVWTTVTGWFLATGLWRTDASVTWKRPKVSTRFSAKPLIAFMGDWTFKPSLSAHSRVIRVPCEAESKIPRTKTDPLRVFMRSLAVAKRMVEEVLLVLSRTFSWEEPEDAGLSEVASGSSELFAGDSSWRRVWCFLEQSMQRRGETHDSTK